MNTCDDVKEHKTVPGADYWEKKGPAFPGENPLEVVLLPSAGDPLAWVQYRVLITHFEPQRLYVFLSKYGDRRLRYSVCLGKSPENTANVCIPFDGLTETGPIYISTDDLVNENGNYYLYFYVKVECFSDYFINREDISVMICPAAVIRRSEIYRG